MSRIILALPTKLEHVEIFEQTVTGGFSSVNTRLASDTQILLRNLEHKDDLENIHGRRILITKLLIILNLMVKKQPKKELLQKF